MESSRTPELQISSTADVEPQHSRHHGVVLALARGQLLSNWNMEDRR
jgi:hypothetical protein